VPASGCNLLEVEPASKLTQTEPIATQLEVVELGPLDPDRVYVPSAAPIANALPGDRVRARIVVVDERGRALPDEAIDGLWFHCGVGFCDMGHLAPDDTRYDQDCATLDEWTTDDACRLGPGSGSIEFEVPALGEEAALLLPQITLYAALAWDGQSAEDCWAARRAGEVIDPRCAFIEQTALLGPEWWMLAYAESVGLESPWDIDLFPAPLYFEQANRAPIVSAVEVEVDGEPRETLIPGPDGVAGPLAIELGGRAEIQVVLDPLEQGAQIVFAPIDLEGSFALLPERVWRRVSTTRSLRYEIIGQPLPDPVPGNLPPIQTEVRPFAVLVEDDAAAGRERVVIVVHDERGGETVVYLELDVQ
jgi:hypothetical protein